MYAFEMCEHDFCELKTLCFQIGFKRFAGSINKIMLLLYQHPPNKH